jgi:hypothetical protein
VRKILRSAVVGAVCGTVVLGTAWAVVGVTPPSLTNPPSGPSTATNRSGAANAADATEADLPTSTPADGIRLPRGQFLAGAAKISIAPDPAKWLPNIPAGTCGEDTATYAPSVATKEVDGKTCLATFDHRWATTIDPDGLFVRAVAIGNGEKTVIFASIDAVGWFAAYPADVCADRGSDAIRAAVAERTKDSAHPVAADGVLITATHTHAAPDTLTQTPTWYYQQVRDAITKALVDAAGALEPVVLETGGTPAKAYNVDRRIFTRAVPDAELGWVRAFRPAEGDAAERTVATIANFAAHPTVRVSNAELHGGFVGALTRHIESKVGGTAVWFPGALGDQTVDRGFGTEGLGQGLADVLADDLGRGYRLQDNTIALVHKPVGIPAENTFMMAARGTGLFVRDLLPPYSGPGGPATASKRGIPRPSCTTVAELTVNSSVTGIRIGRPGLPQRGDPGESLTIITAPGEVFSSIGLITKDYLSKTRNVLVFAQTNDVVGYLIPKEQYDESAAQGLGLANNADDMGNYEEALSLGRCAGDTVQNTMLEAGEELGVMGSGEGR